MDEKLFLKFKENQISVDNCEVTMRRVLTISNLLWVEIVINSSAHISDENHK